MRLEGSRGDILKLDSDDDTEQVLAFLVKEQLRGQEQLVIVVPEGAAAFQTLTDFQALKKMTREYPLQVGFVSTRRSNAAALARNRKFPVFETLEEFHQTGWETASAFPSDSGPLSTPDFSRSSSVNSSNAWPVDNSTEEVPDESETELIHGGRSHHSLPLASALVGAWASVKIGAPRIVEQSRSRLGAITGSIFAGGSRSQHSEAPPASFSGQDPATPLLPNRGGAPAHSGEFLDEEDVSRRGPEADEEPMEAPPKPRRPILLYNGIVGVTILLLGTIIATFLTVYKNPVNVAPAHVTVAITPATKALNPPKIKLLAVPGLTAPIAVKQQIGYRQLKVLDATGTYKLTVAGENTKSQLRKIAVADLKLQLATRVQSQLASGDLWLNFPDSYRVVSESYSNRGGSLQLTMKIEQNPKVLNKAQVNSVLASIVKAKGIKVNGATLMLVPGGALKEIGIPAVQNAGYVDTNVPVHLLVSTSGIFEYTIDRAAQKRIASNIAGQTRTAALEYLQRDPQLAGAKIALSPTNAEVMPAAPGDITITVLPVQQRPGS